MLNLSRKIYLIGGAPTAGKSTIAGKIAARLNIPWISTDQIRSILRICADSAEYPMLFDAGKMTAEQFFARYTPKEIAEREMRQASSVWPAVKMMIETDYTWENGFVVEGVNITPELVAKDFKDNKNVKAVFLVDDDVDHIREVCNTRGLWDDADKYPNNLKELEVQWVGEFSKMLRTECNHYNFQCIDVSKQEDDLSTVLKAFGINWDN